MVQHSITKILLHIHNITNYLECDQFVQSIMPDYVVNLSGISFIPHIDYRQIYDVNFNGAVNILKAYEEHIPRCKLLLVSSGQIYASRNDAINESHQLKLSNHYAMKLLWSAWRFYQVLM